MIRFIAVGEPDFNCEWFLPVTAIHSFSKDDKTGKARIHFVQSDTAPGELEDTLSSLPFEQALPILLGTPPGPLMMDIGPDEARHIKATLESTRRTLDSITYSGGPARSLNLADVLADVTAVTGLLSGGEWAEHCTKSEPGQRLESEITRLIGHDNAATNKLQRAEQLLAEIHHAVNNDGGLYPIGPDSDLVARLSEYLYPDSTNC